MTITPKTIIQKAQQLREQGMSYVDIASLLGISERTVKTHCIGLIPDKRNYLSLAREVTTDGLEYFKGYTKDGHYVEMSLSGEVYYSEAADWNPSKNLPNVRKALKRVSSSSKASSDYLWYYLWYASQEAALGNSQRDSAAYFDDDGQLLYR